MDFLNKYWKIFTAFVFILVTAVGLQSQVAANSASIADNKASQDKESEEIREVVQKETDEIKKKIEQQRLSAKSERDAIKLKQEKTTVIEANQTHILKGMDDMKSVIRELAAEIRESRRGK